MMNPPTLPLTSDIIAQFNDLSAARATASFDAGGMSRVLYSDAAQTKRERALKIVESEPVLRKLIEDW